MNTKKKMKTTGGGKISGFSPTVTSSDRPAGPLDREFKRGDRVKLVVSLDPRKGFTKGKHVYVRWVGPDAAGLVLRKRDVSTLGLGHQIGTARAVRGQIARVRAYTRKAKAPPRGMKKAKTLAAPLQRKLCKGDRVQVTAHVPNCSWSVHGSKGGSAVRRGQFAFVAKRVADMLWLVRRASSIPSFMALKTPNKVCANVPASAVRYAPKVVKTIEPRKAPLRKSRIEAAKPSAVRYPLLAPAIPAAPGGPPVAGRVPWTITRLMAAKNHEGKLLGNLPPITQNDLREQAKIDPTSVAIAIAAPDGGVRWVDLKSYGLRQGYELDAGRAYAVVPGFVPPKARSIVPLTTFMGTDGQVCVLHPNNSVVPLTQLHKMTDSPPLVLMYHGKEGVVRVPGGQPLDAAPKNALPLVVGVDA